MILTAVRWYLAYPLSSRQVLELLAERGIIDEHGMVVGVLLREHRDPASAGAFLRQTIARSAVVPTEVVTDQHEPYITAVATTCPGALHIRRGLHRARSDTTKAIERSQVPTRDWLRNNRGLKRTQTGSAVLEGMKPCAMCGEVGPLAPVTWCVAQQPTCWSGRWWLLTTRSGTACAGPGRPKGTCGSAGRHSGWLLACSVQHPTTFQTPLPTMAQVGPEAQADGVTGVLSSEPRATA